MTFFSKEKLENFLIANWSKFLDVNKLFSFILIQVRDCNNLIEINQVKTDKMMKITISRLELDKNITFWFDFTIPKKEGIAVGTHELVLGFNSEIISSSTYGNLFLNTKQVQDGE